MSYGVMACTFDGTGEAGMLNARRPNYLGQNRGDLMSKGFLIAAIVCFVLDVFAVRLGFNLQSAGLACIAAAMLA
jgi:hypothetical protein